MERRTEAQEKQYCVNLDGIGAALFWAHHFFRMKVPQGVTAQASLLVYIFSHCIRIPHVKQTRGSYHCDGCCGKGILGMSFSCKY